MVRALRFFSNDPAALWVAVILTADGRAHGTAILLNGLIAQELIDGGLGARLGVHPFHDHRTI